MFETDQPSLHPLQLHQICLELTIIWCQTHPIIRQSALTVEQKIEGRSRCDVCAVRHEGICGALSSEELAELGEITRRKHRKRGQVIMSDEMPVEYFCNIVSGVVKLNKTSEDGRQSIIGLLFPPDFLGRVYAEKNPYFAEAVTD